MAKKKRKFKLRENVGTHRDEHGKIHKPGATITTEHDLVAMFGSSKFEAVGTFIPEEEDDKPKNDTPSDDERGEDVTDDFDDAIEHGLLVFKKDNKWWVYEGEELLAGPIKKGQVADSISDAVSE